MISCVETFIYKHSGYITFSKIVNQEIYCKIKVICKFSILKIRILRCNFKKDRRKFN